MWLGKAINAIQWFWSEDGEAKYSHAGMILDNRGTTFEALWTVSSRNIFSAYAGENVIIARPRCDSAAIDKALDAIITEHKGQWYPGWRLFMHLIPPASKITFFDRLVCSELCAKYLYLAGARHDQYTGTNPDTLADEWREWKHFDVVFEGKLPNG